jgi:tetratricopeptide (TPR) repeat protein
MKYFRSFAVIIFACMASIAPQVTLASQTALELATQSMEECQRGRSAEARDLRLAHYKQAQVLAEKAVALNDKLPDAHYSLFCTLGEQLRIDGENLSSAFGFPAMMAELNRTLELNPNHLSAISSKATFLVRLPSFFGGDVKKGEALLRRVIREDSTCINARLTLANVLADRGDYPEAISLATQALKYSNKKGQDDFIQEAKRTLTQLRSKYYASR